MGNFLYFHFDDYDNSMVTQEELKSLLSAIANGELYIKKWVLGDGELDSHLYIKFSSEQYWTGSMNMGISLQRTFAVKKIILFDAF